VARACLGRVCAGDGERPPGSPPSWPALQVARKNECPREDSEMLPGAPAFVMVEMVPSVLTTVWLTGWEPDTLTREPCKRLRSPAADRVTAPPESGVPFGACPVSNSVVPGLLYPWARTSASGPRVTCRLSR